MRHTTTGEKNPAVGILAEQLFPLNEATDLAPDLLPKRRGRKIHQSTLYRWAGRGAHGRRLETCRAGGILLTSREALERFLYGDTSPAVNASLGTSSAIDRAERELKRAGI